MNFVLGGPAETVSPEDLEEKRQQRERLMKLADPALMRRIDRWIYHRMVPLNPSLPMALKPQSTHFDKISDWYCGYLGVRAEFEPPPEMSQDLKESVPQAALRDIYRPVRADVLVEPFYHDLALDPGGRRAFAEARASIKREPIPTIEPVVLVIIAEQRRRRRFLKRPWPSFRTDDAPRRYTDQDTGLYTDDDDASSGEGDGE